MQVASGGADPGTQMRWRAFWRVLPLAVLIMGVAAFFALGFQQYLSFEQLSKHRHTLLEWRDRHALLAVVAFIGIYVMLAALSIPGAIWMTIVGGFLFGVALGGAYSVIGATLGSVCVFLAARLIAGDWLRRRAGSRIARMEEGLRRDGLSYLLVLRLMPVFPFWLVNLVPALIGVPLRTFILGTLLGIIPGSLVYASVGNGLGAVIAEGGTPDLGIIFRPDVLGPMLGLAALALLPVAYRRLKQRGGADPEGGPE